MFNFASSWFEPSERGFIIQHQVSVIVRILRWGIKYKPPGIITTGGNALTAKVHMTHPSKAA